MSKFHITENGPKKCSASVRDCKYGTPDGGGHYTNEKEAVAAYERQQVADNGLVATVSKKAAEPKKLGTPTVSLEGKLSTEQVKRVESSFKDFEMPEYDGFLQGTFNKEAAQRFHDDSEARLLAHAIIEANGVDSSKITGRDVSYFGPKDHLKSVFNANFIGEREEIAAAIVSKMESKFPDESFGVEYAYDEDNPDDHSKLMEFEESEDPEVAEAYEKVRGEYAEKWLNEEKSNAKRYLNGHDAATFSAKLPDGEEFVVTLDTYVSNVDKDSTMKDLLLNRESTGAKPLAY